MYIYNVTINIEETIHDRWLHWMKTEHIPAMLATEKFSKALLTRVIIEEEMGGITYSVQYTTDSKATLQKYYDENADELRAQSKPFEGKFVAFRTELEVIGEAHNELFKKS
ncbi:hypothetical protein Aeqsu_0987 [Aequorivita sublithincola DSM 14238]|uniref:DUF4286 domain-containing protein n=1 Tax=Aequorivita sublithincola (strain DSM 14238 / LMG 21431 / ACAM 643 / 9-3) TaxID=746697 RepID=I3YU20_AEQSU|nr:DUF4286 family protein [Aequorivita sublithincola]AFL80488.1 hypothetical protein Aeqsu_0987 [Aequorivita sublithincola DSM 14238]